mmetsp:Transcript_24991/g.38673  ORF Transcript_24991/g.38673 Transcript_24991/m.38673 type:complete len:104 (+) Transcript_24991:167-478(+)
MGERAAQEVPSTVEELATELEVGNGVCWEECFGGAAEAVDRGSVLIFLQAAKGVIFFETYDSVSGGAGETIGFKDESVLEVGFRWGGGAPRMAAVVEFVRPTP